MWFVFYPSVLLFELDRYDRSLLGQGGKRNLLDDNIEDKSSLIGSVGEGDGAWWKVDKSVHILLVPALVFILRLKG